MPKDSSLCDELESLSTETSNTGSTSLSRLSTRAILRKINEEDQKVPLAVKNEIPKITKAVDLIVETLKTRGRLVYVGAGTSGRLGVLDAAELLPTFGVGHELVRALIAGGRKAMFHPVEGIEDLEEEAVKDLRKIALTPRDIVVGISASGRTPYVVGALKYAKKLGAKTVGLTVNRNSALGKIAEVTICPSTGPEVLTGSTRMKAGTAEKLVLNMISTAVMVKLGKVHGNMMVELRPLSKKLLERQKKIVASATGLPYGQVERLLEEAQRDAKVAIVMAKFGMKYRSAKKRLEQSNGSLDRALHSGTMRDP